MIKSAGYAAKSATTPLDSFTFDRREPTDHDVQIDILYCGVCHTDLHYVKNEWKSTVYPVVPGHEIVGRVVKIGKAVKGFKVGDLAAVGCMVDSCRTCPNCKDNLEQFCNVGSTFTYNSPDKQTGKNTYGGYSTSIVVDENYVLHVPKSFKESDLPGVAPLLCAGITTYSPLKHWDIKKGKKVGVIGLGGLGHMAVKLAHAMGAQVVLFTSSPQKVADGKKLGADEVVISKNKDEMNKHLNSFDLILDTVTVSHDLDAYIQLLNRDGTLCMLGVSPEPHPSPNVANFIFRRRNLSGSLIGGIKETQEMLDFCAKHHILSDIELIKMPYINQAYDRMVKSDVKYRFVIDIANSLKA